MNSATHAPQRNTACTYCGQDRDAAAGQHVPSLGWCCSGCVSEINEISGGAMLNATKVVSTSTSTGATARLMDALRQLARPVTNAQLQAATGLKSASIPGLLRWNVQHGRVIRAGGPRSATYALPEFAAPASAPAPATPAAAPAAAALSPVGSSASTSCPPAAKLTVRPTPRGRFEVDPAEVPLMFSALRPGQYQGGDTWARRYVEGGDA